jgi:hypothetical protein
MIFSFSYGSKLNTALATKVMVDWTVLATAGERNIPMLFLGPHALAIGNARRFENDMSQVAKENHFDVLGLWNLTEQVTANEGGQFGQEVAMVEAMMVVNWLSKLATS